MNTINKLLKTQYVQSAIKEQADLSAFKEKPTLKIITGVFLIIISFLICWPTISVLGAISIYFNEPLVIIIGGPTLYGLSHLIFLLGMYLSGTKYSKIFLKWITRVTMEKIKEKPV